MNLRNPTLVLALSLLAATALAQSASDVTSSR